MKKNIKGKVYVNHNLPSDEALGEALAPFGYTGFVTNFGANSSSEPTQEPGRLFCSCGHRDGKYPLNYNISRQEVKCPNCGGAIRYIHAPRSGGHGWYGSSNLMNVTTIDESNPDRFLVQVKSFQVNGSAATPTAPENTYVNVTLGSEDSFAIVRLGGGKYAVEGNISSINACNLYQCRDNFLGRISAFWPEFGELIALATRNDSSTDPLRKLLGYLNSPLGITQFMMGMMDLPNIYNKENILERPLVISRFTVDQAKHSWGNFFVASGRRMKETDSYESIYAYYGIPASWPCPDRLFDAELSYNVFNNIVKMDKFVLEEVVKTPLFKWAIHRLNHETIPATSFGSLLTYMARKIDGKKEDRYNARPEVYKYWDEFCEFVIHNCDQYPDVDAEFSRRVRTLEGTAAMITSDTLRNRCYNPAINSTKYKTLRNTDVDELIMKDPLALIKRLRK